MAEFAGATGQRRAKISGNRLTVFLVRARVAAPGDPRTKSTPADARPGPGRLPQSAPGARQEGAGTPPRRSKGPRVAERSFQDAQDGLQTALEAAKKPQESLKRPSKRAPTSKIVPFP